MNIVVDIADMRVSSDQQSLLVTYSLGSCLGVTIYDPVNKIGGMLHAMLPLSKTDSVKADKKPYMFVDTGLSKLLNELFSYGCKKSDLIVKVAGCSRILDEKKIFNIGERNFTVARKIFWKNDILIHGEDVGGAKTRTMFLDIATGITTLKISGQKINI